MLKFYVSVLVQLYPACNKLLIPEMV